MRWTFRSQSTAACSKSVMVEAVPGTTVFGNAGFERNTLTMQTQSFSKLRSVLTLVAIVIANVVLLSPAAFAHGGFDHVIGNVVKVANNVVTVKTSTGNVDVKLDDKTEVTKNKVKAQLSDLTPGTRVVIDIPEGPEGVTQPSKDRIAHAVKIGAPTGAAPASEHAGHEGH